MADNVWYWTQWALKYREVPQDTAERFGEWAAEHADLLKPEWEIWEDYQTYRWTQLYGDKRGY